MVQSCVAYGCTNRAIPASKITFHSPAVKAASLRLTRARLRLARKGSYPKDKPEESPTSRPQTRPHPRRQQPPKKPAATQRNRGGRVAAITKPAAISTATQTDEFLSQSPPRNEESSEASSSSPHDVFVLLLGARDTRHNTELRKRKCRELGTARAGSVVCCSRRHQPSPRSICAAANWFLLPTSPPQS
ncbi:hypothetical protein MRX96_031915 [Rhipicephalus microplus]